MPQREKAIEAAIVVLKKYTEEYKEYSKVNIDVVKEVLANLTKNLEPVLNNEELFEHYLIEKLEKRRSSDEEIMSHSCIEIILTLFTKEIQAPIKNRLLVWMVRWERQIHIFFTFLAIITPIIIAIIQEK